MVDEISFENPQNKFGLDIITRARLSTSSSVYANRVTEIIRTIIAIKITELLENHDISPKSVSRVVIVGNSVMHHLFVGYPVASFLQSPYAAYKTEGIFTTAKAMEISNEAGGGLQSSTECYFPPLLHSFIGSDALAVLLKSMQLGERLSLAIDVGTNTEIILRTDDKIWVASAPSGPALEGMTISCGMPANAGAIDSISIEPASYKPTVHTIDGKGPKGICGSGAVSLLSELLRVGLLNEEGSLVRDVLSSWLVKQNDSMTYLVVPANQSADSSSITLSQVDIRLLQQSKAAIRTCVDLVLKHAGHKGDEIKQLYLTGVFGSELDLEAAYRIGMLPRCRNADIVQARGGASEGAQLILTNTYLHREIIALHELMEFLDLMDNPEFDERFAWARMFSQ